MTKPWFNLRRQIYVCTMGILLSAIYTIPASAQNIVFKHENISDLRGLLNVFNAFQQSCLTEPVSQNLPVKLRPNGYQIISREKHIEFDEHKNSNRAAILSKTGLEQSDWDEGHPYIDFFMPTDASPFGECTIYWKRAWDYEDGQERIAFSMHGALDAQISYYLQAVLTTRPADAFIPKGAYAGSSDWYTKCWDGKLCEFRIIHNFNPKRGIDISMQRIGVHDQ